MPKPDACTRPNPMEMKGPHLVTGQVSNPPPHLTLGSASATWVSQDGREDTGFRLP